MLDSMLERVYYSLKSRLFCKLFKQGEGAGFSFLASFPPSLLYYRPPISLSLTIPMKTLFSLVVIHDQTKPFNTQSIQCCRIENNRNAEISSTTLPPLPQVIHSPSVHRKGHWSSICEGRRGLLHSPCALPPLYVNNFTTVIGACCWMTVVGCWM